MRPGMTLLAGISAAYAYDASAALTSDGSRTYSWDARGRLTGISGVATYLYDAEGRRIKTTPTTGSAASVVYDDVDVVQEQLAGVASANLLNGPGIDEHLTRATLGTGAATSTLLTDALGSIVALASSAGTVATRYGYTPYGAAGVTGTANTNPYQFTGAPQDGSGLIYMRARYYNPVWGRFISEDPIGLAGGINRYAYADGNPDEIVDPLGLDGVRRNGSDGGKGGDGSPEAEGGESGWAKAADVAEGVSAFSGDLAIGFAIAGAATSWTGVGFFTFEGAAAFFEGASLASGAASAGFKTFDGDYTGAGVALGVSLFNARLGRFAEEAAAKGVASGLIGKKREEIINILSKVNGKITETLFSPGPGRGRQ